MFYGAMSKKSPGGLLSLREQGWEKSPEVVFAVGISQGSILDRDFVSARQEVHHMDGVLLEEPPPPLGVPSPPPLAVGPNGAEAASCRNIPSICEGVGCNRQAKFGYEGATQTACARHRLESMVLRTTKGCETPDCHRAAFYGFDVKQQATACGIHKIRGMVDLKHKRCEVVDCVRHRVYGVPGGKARFCSRHKEPGMCNVVSRRCSIEGCSKIPTHSSEVDKGYRVCTSHKAEGMINISTNRACDAPECSRNPIFGFEGQRSSRCAAHKEEGMLDVKHARCMNRECSKVAAYAFEGEKPRFCFGHKEAGMLSMKHRRCAQSACTRQPVFGFVGGKATLCSGHKVDGMRNVLDKCCLAPACRKLPTFGSEDGKPTACASHKTLGMVNVRNRRCEIYGCTKQPRFGIIGGKPRVCLDHSQNDMAELRPAHQGRTKKLKVADIGAVAVATSSVSVLPVVSHTEGLAGVGSQTAVAHLVFLSPSVDLVTRSNTLQRVDVGRVAQGVGPQRIMPHGILPEGSPSQELVSASLSPQGVGPQPMCTTAQEMSKALTPGVPLADVAGSERGVCFSDARQAVAPTSIDFLSMDVSTPVVAGQPTSTLSVGLRSKDTVPTMLIGQSVSISSQSCSLPSEAMQPALTTAQAPLCPNSTGFHSTTMSPSTTTGERDSTNSTSPPSEVVMRTSGRLVSTSATGLQSDTVEPGMAIRHPLSSNSTSLHSTVMPPAMATGQSSSTHSLRLHPEAMAPAVSTGVLDRPRGALGGVTNAAAATMQPPVPGYQACQQHKQSGMIYGFGSRCRFRGCAEQPRYGFDDEGPRFCRGHRSDGMSDRATTSSREVECRGGRAMDGLHSPSGEQSYVHQAAAMMGGDSVKMRRRFCVWETCLQPPLYSWSGEDSPRFCEAHACPGMVPPSPGGHPCRYHACFKQACFAFEGEACRFCHDHCADGMMEMERRQCHHRGCTGLAAYSSDLHPVNGSYPSLPPSSASNSPLVDDKTSHDMSSPMSHRFSAGQEAHDGIVHDAIGASSNRDEIGYLRSGNGSLGSQPLGNEDTRSSHALPGRQSELFPPSSRQTVGVDMAHHADGTPGHHPSPFHHPH